MNDRVKWIEYQGNKILYSNYNGLKGDMIIDLIKIATDESLNSGMKKVYVLNDVTDSFMSKESTTAAKDWIDSCKKKGIAVSVALVGVEGIKKFIASTIRKDMFFASNMDEAKEWLIKQ